MKLKIYSVLDSAVGAYLQPFFARSEGEAVRMLKLAVNDPASNFNKHAQDYTLAFLGSFDDETGDLENATRSNLLNLSSLQEAEKPDIDMMKHFMQPALKQSSE
ncbi:nonstructural protein [Blackfly microvirus SF02]|uniref:Nonstructural protein n=1 Tax=Blackfly microvirus SF02 TaxID=2576452 RepID=A0A4P8PJT2_9VIRU|nr:nonstructural protein [Blackfly microvirus SF02]